jgi:hypothetical protein
MDRMSYSCSTAEREDGNFFYGKRTGLTADFTSAYIFDGLKYAPESPLLVYPTVIFDFGFHKPEKGEPVNFTTETLAALKEANELLNDPNTKKYSSFSEILAEAEAEMKDGLPD